MSQITRLAAWLCGLLISGVFLDSLRFKFTGHNTPTHIFTTLREWSGIDLFYPAGPWIIGLGELLAASLLIFLPLASIFLKRQNLIAPFQAAGALIALGIMSGAIFFHLFTPLGIETPVEWDDETPTNFSSALFNAACASWGAAMIILLLRGRSIVVRKS